MKIPLLKKSHKAAVKALAWSPTQVGILATGAGTADRCLRIWNVHKKSLVDYIDTGSQICNLIFSKKENEVITAHGFSTHEINIWQTRGLKKLASLNGHTSRVLYLSLSPTGEYIVSGAGDETLRFWKLNYSNENSKPAQLMNVFNPKSLR